MLEEAFFQDAVSQEVEVFVQVRAGQADVEALQHLEFVDRHFPQVRAAARTLDLVFFLGLAFVDGFDAGHEFLDAARHEGQVERFDSQLGLLEHGHFGVPFAVGFDGKNINP